MRQSVEESKKQSEATDRSWARCVGCNGGPMQMRLKAEGVQNSGGLG